jgi:lipoprotein-anchoring transpeptidase ErfK/SrfK
MMRVLWAVVAVSVVSGQAPPPAGAPPARIVASFGMGSVNNVIQSPLVRGSGGSGVARVQILLSRAHFSCGEIDGDFGSNLQKTVAAFQAERKLPATGDVDDATWAALNADQSPALEPYTISVDDLKGPFIQIPASTMAQAKLAALGYASPLEELAERFHASPGLLEKLNPGADFSKPGQQLAVPNAITPPPSRAARVVVSRSESSVRAYDSAGALLAFYVATTGSQHDPLPLGSWKIEGVRRNPDYQYNSALFWDAGKRNRKALIKPGPNNPVGVVWIDLSKEHYGIHGTPGPDLIGHAFSHGCIRLTNWDAMELASMVKPGTPAELKE